MAHTGLQQHPQDWKFDTEHRPKFSRAGDATQNGSRGANITWTDVELVTSTSQMGGTDPVAKSGLAECTLSENRQTSTPPIDVPHAGDKESAISKNGATATVDVSSLEDYIRNRSTSISFSPEVLLDTGHRQNMDEPLRKPSVDSRPRGRSLLQEADERSNSPRAHSESAREHYDPVTGERLAEDPRTYHRADQNTGGEMLRHPCSNDDLTDHERPTSLTSLSTASPTTEEIKTPPDGDQDFFSRLPETVSSPVQSPTSLEESSAWPPQRQRFSDRSKTYTFGRSPSMRKAMRQSSGFSSRRSTASSGKSPAAMFLSQWSAPEEKAPEPDEQGQTIGDKYVIGRQIGFGGFSVVKEAMTIDENGEERKVAVKIVKKNISGRDEQENEQAQAEFDHEVDLWRSLKHPHVLPLEAVYNTDYATFCFTALKIGGTLFDLVKKNRKGIGMDLAQRYACQMARALRYLHQDAHVVHRDIKLENCLVDHSHVDSAEDGGDVVLCDFGMAEWLDTEHRMGNPGRYDHEGDRSPPRNIGPSDTSTSIAGSLDYASPELLTSSNGLVSPGVDVWAFGVCVYALIVGDRPFKNGFEPRLRMMIIKGEWKEEMVLQGEGDEESRHDALEMLRNCLHMEANKRWTIEEVLRCKWLKGCLPEKSEDW